MPAKSGKAKRRRTAASKSSVAKTRSSSKATKNKKKVAPAKKAQPAALTFRTRVPSDDEFILNLTEAELGQVHAQAFGEAFPRAQFQGYLQSGAPTIVVEQEKKPIGYYSYLVAPDGKMHVTALVIQPKHQSDGVGTQVMSHLEEDAKSRNVHTLEVFVQENNQRSVAFTKKLGFVEVYRTPPNSICFQKVISRSDGTSVAVGQLPAVGPDGMPLW